MHLCPNFFSEITFIFKQQPTYIQKVVVSVTQYNSLFKNNLIIPR